MTLVKMKCYNGPLHGKIVPVDDYEKYHIGQIIQIGHIPPVTLEHDLSQPIEDVKAIILEYIFKGDRLVYAS